MKVLIVDDEKNIRDSMAEYLGLERFETVTAEDGNSGKKFLEEDVFDAVVLDLKMPGLTGLELLSWLQKEGPEVPAIMMSAFGEVQDAVGAMKLGARDYLVKPFDPEELVLRLRRIDEENSLRRKARVYDKGDTWIGESLSMKQVKNLVERVAPTMTTVLITGESGTGKEVAAREIHRLSQRGAGPFVPINLGGIPDTLLESELFGYEKGAFTGAERRKEGLFELASKGTLFLDEIGDMPLHLQVKLLRVIQDKKIQRLGGTGNIPIDVRIVAATNRDLEARVKEGTFREDLYYRLNVIRLHLPPLRERKEDVPLLAAFFLDRFARETPAKSRRLGPTALEALNSHSFPGNVRELENMIERACILSENEVLAARDLSLASGSSSAAAAENDLSFASAAMPDSFPSGPKTVKDMEKEAVIEALKRREGNRTRASADLGITRRTLLNKIKEYGIEL